MERKERRMRSETMRRLGVVLVVAVALGTAGGALACDRSGSAEKEAMRTLASHHHRGAVFGVISSYLGLTNAQITAQLKAGKSLAEIANATPGKSATGLVDAIVTAVKTRLDAKVAAHRITPALEARILASVRTRVTRIVYAHFHP